MRLKWLYKIYSNYDGFRPAAIPERLRDGNLLELGWERYLDDVETGDDVWVYFHGRHRFENGVYVKCMVRRVDRRDRTVYLRVREYSISEPLTDAVTSARVAAVVATRYRQVFLFPTELEPVPACDLATAASTCANRLCRSCPTWQSLPLIRPADVAMPERVGAEVKDVVSAYWVIPSRCYLHAEHKPVQVGVRRASEQFYRFKTGDQNLAYPLALGIFEALQARHLLEQDFDAVVPIPLSPDKESRHEINRTRLLARELALLLDVKPADLLKLDRPISKRALGLAPRYFEARYARALEVSSTVAQYRRIVLLDDVATWGSTVAAAASRMVSLNPALEILAVTAGRMILKSSVRDEVQILA
jgi:predicted amidophosphoribosyltransferase